MEKYVSYRFQCSEDGSFYRDRRHQHERSGGDSAGRGLHGVRLRLAGFGSHKASGVHGGEGVYRTAGGEHRRRHRRGGLHGGHPPGQSGVHGRAGEGHSHAQPRGAAGSDDEELPAGPGGGGHPRKDHDHLHAGGDLHGGRDRSHDLGGRYPGFHRRKYPRGRLQAFL